jgi:hypothetical protein
MATRHLAALALAAAFIPTPAGASDLANYEGPGMKFYYRIPLDAGRGKESMPAFGLQMRGERPHEVVNFDNHLVNNFLAGGIAAKWIEVGVVAAGATVAVAAKDKSTSQQYEQQKQAQAAQGHAPGDGCTNSCGGPAHWSRLY